MNKKRMSINLIANIMAFSITMLINFIITPYIVKALGNEAYGFISLANTFVNYTMIITVAINSMAARFISIEIHKGDIKKANTYFNSVLFSNIILSSIIFILSIVIVMNLTSIINIPVNLVNDVRMTFALSFVNLIISLIMSVYSTATFVKNRLDMASIRNIVVNIIRVILLMFALYFFQPKITYVIAVGMIATILNVITDKIFCKKLLPELKINFKDINKESIKTLFSSGIWNSITSMSDILLTGLDLMIANLLISVEDMGILSIAKTIPTQMVALVYTIASIFLPQFVMMFAKNQCEELKKEIKFGAKIIAYMLGVPFAGFLIFGQEFYGLWLPYKGQEEIIKIQILSILTLIPTIVGSFIYTAYTVNSVTNKIKIPSLTTLGVGVLSTIIVFILLKTTDMGIYAVAGVSSILLTLRLVIFIPLYSAHNLKSKWNTFYPLLIRGTLSFLATCLLFYLIKMNIVIDSWISLIVIAVICAIIGYIFNIFTLFNKNDIKKIINMLISRFKKNKVLE